MQRSQSTGVIFVLLLGVCLPATRADRVRFVITSDSRGQAGHAQALAAVNSVAGGPGDFIITPGDMDPLTTTRAQIDSAFGSGFLWFPVMGNHEQEDMADVNYLRDFYWDVLEGIVNPGPDGTTETTYSFDAGPVHIVVINVYWNGTTAVNADIGRDGDVVTALRNWLAADLATSTKPWNLVFSHEPAYPQADQQWRDVRHAGDSLDKYRFNRDAFWQVLEDNGVIACFTAHTHRYSSYRPLGSSVWQIDSAQAQKSEQYDTFFIITADDEGIIVEVYRSLLRGSFALLERINPADLPQSEIAVFQHGVEDYTGTVDTFVHQAQPNSNFSTSPELDVDGENQGGKVESLIRFDNIIGDNPGQIPDGERIVSAALRFYTTNPSDSNDVQFHRMLIPWNDTDTWNSIGNGVATNGGEAASHSDGVLPADNYSGIWHTVDVTASLRAWAEYGDVNYGWALMPDSTDGWSCYSSEGTHPPQLLIEYDARPLEFVRFEQGVEDYSACADTRLRQAYPDHDYAGDTRIVVDSTDGGGASQGLIRFGQIIGDGPGQIPPEATIVAAKLRIRTSSPTTNNDIMLHRMLTDWADTDTWNSTGGGISADEVEAEAMADAFLPADNRAAWHHEVDVTASLRAWVEDGQVNHGWVLLPTGGDSWGFDSAESSAPPQLVAWFEVPGIIGDLNCDGLVDQFDVGSFVNALVNPAGYAQNYPECDYLLADCNNDGSVNSLDIDPFIGLLTGS